MKKTPKIPETMRVKDECELCANNEGISDFGPRSDECAECVYTCVSHFTPMPKLAEDMPNFYAYLKGQKYDHERLKDEIQLWNDMKEVLEDHVSCSRCGDGGCPHCDPKMYGLDVRY